MKLKSFTLLFILALCANNTAQAMRRANKPIKQAFTQLRFYRITPFTGLKWGFRILRYSYILMGLGVFDSSANAMGQDDQEDIELPPCSIENLDITDINAVVNALKHATEEDKRLVAQQIAQHIMSYTTKDIITMLQCTEKRPHRIIAKAVAQHITEFDTTNIIKILNRDATQDTHWLIAQALKKNITFFTRDSQKYATYLYAYSPAIYFADILKELRPYHQGIVVKAITENICRYSERDIEAICNACTQENKLAIEVALTKLNMILTVSDNFSVRKKD